MGSEIEQAKDKPQLEATNKGLLPRTLDDLFRMASWLNKSGLMPKALDTPEKVMVAVQMGMECGLTPTQACQNIAVINGKPSLYGDGALGVVQASGLIEDFKEEPIVEKGETTGYRCTAKRKGVETPIVREFTLKDASKAGLLNKRGPWQEYTNRMLQMRARAFCLRDGFADALKGLAIAEERLDIKTVEARVIEKTAQTEAALVAELSPPAEDLPESLRPDQGAGEPEAATPPVADGDTPAPDADDPVEQAEMFDVAGSEFE